MKNAAGKTAKIWSLLRKQLCSGQIEKASDKNIRLFKINYDYSRPLRLSLFFDER